MIEQITNNENAQGFQWHFTGIGCFEDTFKLHVREGSCPYQAPPKRVSYALQEPLWEKLDRLSKQQIIVYIDVDETSEWCNSFMLVLKANGKVRLLLDPAWLNKVLIRTIHRDPTLNSIQPRFASVKYLTLINTSSGYHKVMLDEQSSYLTIFSCPFGRHGYIQLPIGVALAADMFQKNIMSCSRGCQTCLALWGIL